jgi:hypothetical protein
MYSNQAGLSMRIFWFFSDREWPLFSGFVSQADSTLTAQRISQYCFAKGLVLHYAGIAMTPEAAWQKQLECYRKMTGEQRLLIALNLHELACTLARAGIRQQYPGATAEEVESRLRQRIQLSRAQ